MNMDWRATNASAMRISPGRPLLRAHQGFLGSRALSLGRGVRGAGRGDLEGPVDKLGLVQPQIARAGESEAQNRKFSRDDERAINAALQAMGVDP